MNTARIAHGLAHTAVDTVRHPVASAASLVGLARGAVHVAKLTPGIVADTITRRTEAENRPAEATPPIREARPVPEATDPGATSAPASAGVPDFEPADPADRVLVVEAALAAEKDESRFGVTTEPHAASRDEEHGQASLARAEIEELEEEAEARE